MAEEKKVVFERANKEKRLEAPKKTNAYQKDWFKNVIQARARAGEPFAAMHACAPMELFRAMDIPFVCWEWWTGICSAKQMGPRFYANLEQNGYDTNTCTYCNTGLACTFDEHPEEGPWGGMPDPTILIGGTTVDCTNVQKIDDLMHHNYPKAKYYPFSLAYKWQDVADKDKWWDRVRYNWEELAGTDRLDFYERELRYMINWLEQETGKSLDEQKLIEVMNLVNIQEDYYSKIRDLMMETKPAPVTLVDTVGAIMQAQWQRGTPWAANFAKEFYEEVKALADKKDPAVPNEKIRLMWIGRGLWFNMGFYKKFEEKYGAAFLWSFYQGMAADAYIRYNVEENPIRALAARFTMLEDWMYYPGFNNKWYLHECEHGDIDGVVIIEYANCKPNGMFLYNIEQDLAKAGIPVTIIHADPADARAWDEEKMTAQMEDFLENQVIPNQIKLGKRDK